MTVDIQNIVHICMVILNIYILDVVELFVAVLTFDVQKVLCSSLLS